jgi:hypothetical protein
MRVLDWDTGDRVELHEFISGLLVAGFWTYPDFAEWLKAWVDDSGLVAPDEAAALLASLWAQRLAETAGWVDTGDFGRMAAAFAALEDDGILARMRFSCCTACATHDIDAQRTRHPEPSDWYGYQQWAYTFFHEQDAQALSRPNATLWLGYSAFRPHSSLPAALVAAASRGVAEAATEVRERTDLLVGAQVLDHLTAAGLAARWSGSARDRIAIDITQWRKPLPVSA